MYLQKMMWFACGLLVGLTVLSITKAAVPIKNKITDDSAIYQQTLSEIRIPKEGKLDFDSEISHLAQLEDQYRESLPLSGTASKGSSRLGSHRKGEVNLRLSRFKKSLQSVQARRGN